jgi:hypothetical protein
MALLMAGELERFGVDQLPIGESVGQGAEGNLGFSAARTFHCELVAEKVIYLS